MLDQWIIFDAMGVIFEVGDDVKDLLIPFLENKVKSINPNMIRREYLNASLGKISSFQFWNALGLGGKFPNIEKEYLDKCLSLDPNFKPIATQLLKNYKLGLLSNDVAEWSSYLREKFMLNSFFETIIISGEVKCRKPDKKIFEILLKRINSPPEYCVFIDDILENLHAASKLGIHTIRFIRNVNKITHCSEFEMTSFNELPSVLKFFF